MKIELRERVKYPDSDWLVILDGQLYDTLYFNLRGYRGTLPTPDGIPLDIGEKSIGVYKKYVRQLNREFEQAKA